MKIKFYYAKYVYQQKISKICANKVIALVLGHYLKETIDMDEFTGYMVPLPIPDEK